MENTERVKNGNWVSNYKEDRERGKEIEREREKTLEREEDSSRLEGKRLLLVYSEHTFCSFCVCVCQKA